MNPIVSDSDNNLSLFCWSLLLLLLPLYQPPSVFDEKAHTHLNIQFASTNWGKTLLINAMNKTPQDASWRFVIAFFFLYFAQLI